jgi:hypothetical protein
MSMFQPPVTHNEQHADDVAGTPPRRAYFYRDSVTLRFRLATGAVPAGGVRAYLREIANDGTNVRVRLNDDVAEHDRLPLLVGATRVLI